MVAFCPRVGRGFRFRFEIAKVIQPQRTPNVTDISEAVEQLVLEINSVLEEAIRRYPEQYLWIHDRYRTQPDKQAAGVTKQAHLETLQADPETA